MDCLNAPFTRNPNGLGLILDDTPRFKPLPTFIILLTVMPGQVERKAQLTLSTNINCNLPNVAYLLSGSLRNPTKESNFDTSGCQMEAQAREPNMLCDYLVTLCGLGKSRVLLHHCRSEPNASVVEEP